MVVGEFTASSIANEQDRMEDDQREKLTTSKVDYAKLDADVAALKALAAKGNRAEALEGLLNLEKQHRLGEDATATKAACAALLEVLFEAKDWKALNEHIVLLAKRRSQLKQVVQAFVRQAMGYLDQAPDKDTRVELIKTLQTVTEGKIYVEIERARLTRRLAGIWEEEGKIDEAADTLQEVAVETFGAMAKTEKIFYILEQVRLCLDRKDYIRAHILAKKVSPRAFVEQPGKKGQATGEVGIEGTTIEAPDAGTPTLEELKLRYYELLIRYHEHHDSYLEICRCYKAIAAMPYVAADAERAATVLRKICWFVVLAPTSSDQVTLLMDAAGTKELEELPAYKELLQFFITPEVVWWGVFSKRYEDEIAAQAEVFGGPGGAGRLKALRLRVTEHNVLVVAKYYSRITLARLAELLDLPVEEARPDPITLKWPCNVLVVAKYCSRIMLAPLAELLDLTAEEAEARLSEMVVAGAVAAKINRPAGIVRFAPRRAPAEHLNAWADNIRRLLEVVERATQDIQKESMVHKVPIGVA